MAGEIRDNWEGSAERTNGAVQWSEKGVDLADPKTRPASVREASNDRSNDRSIGSGFVDLTMEDIVGKRRPEAPQRSDVPVTGREPQLDRGTLRFDLGDKNIDAALARPDYRRIEVRTPPGIQLSHGVDQTGYYFTFDKANGESADGKRHYYPQNAKEMCENNKTYNLDAQRLRSNEVSANSSSNQAHYFDNMNHGTPPNAFQVVKFADRLSNISKAVLVTQEKSLQDSIRAQDADPNSIKNPYFKIYLADVYTAQAMQPLVEQFKATGRINFDNPQTVQRVDMAIRVLNTALQDSRDGLQSTGMKNPTNVVTPMSPYDYYYDRDRRVAYGFWGGSSDQAQQRLIALNTFRNLLTTKSLPSVMSQVIGRVPGGIEILPPMQDKPRYD